ncbi:sporulation protein [Streptomyces sp. NPDC052773]|uniref:sporulation protein n=1 Tax=Streptomyces sp. NPDC052773 TaxID=3365693 RepID=UPI0037D3F90C
MAFRKFLSSLGINAPEVDTVLAASVVRPGDVLEATVHLRGGGADVEVERLRLDVVTRAEDREQSETGWQNPFTIVSEVLNGPLTLHAGEQRTERIAIRLPWEMPLTHVLGGRRLRGARVAVRTELAIDDAVDKGDFDEFQVHALPAQDAILQAYADLGFRFDEAEVKLGTPRGGHNSKVGYWQEIETWFPREYGRGDGQLESVFVARADSLDLITGSSGPHLFTYADLDQAAWTKRIDEHMRATFMR